MLVKETLEQSIKTGLSSIYKAQVDKATSGEESENPYDVISKLAGDMAKVIADSVDDYLKSGEIIVGTTNVLVTSNSPGLPAAVVAGKPAKIV